MKPDPTERPYPGDPYVHEASSPADAVARIRALIARSSTTIVVLTETSRSGAPVAREKSAVDPSPEIYVMRANAPLRSCLGCRNLRDCRFGYCHDCCAPLLRGARGGAQG